MGRRDAKKDPLNGRMAAFLKKKRQDLELSQAQVAQTLKMSQTYYSELERGIYKIPLTDFMRFAHKYAPEILPALPKEVKKNISYQT